MRFLLVIFFAITTAVVSACSTAGHVSNDLHFGEADKVLYVSDHYTGYEQEHIGEVIRTFEKYGFAITNDRSKSSYYLDFRIQASATISVNISVLQNGKSVIDVSSSNAGWGTLVARPVAISSRVNEALDKLSEILAQAK